ncbi:MAG: histidine kinase [Bacteroidales bacterium]|nr:histidine kinase [Candidatus Liminaster caballi]
MRISYFLLPIFYLLLGGFVTTLLVNRILQAEDLLWIWIYLPMLLVTLFVAVMGVVNVWIHYRTWHDDDLLVRQIYTIRRMAWLYVRCWLVVVAGVMLVLIFFWMQDFIPASLAPLFLDFKIAFYVISISLTVASLMSIVHGENLAEVRLRQSQNENLLLRSQLNPHFLYNTLNNIDALIWIDQERASSSVNNLSSLMRYFTYSARQDTMPIGEEVDHLRQLVELQRLRMPVPESLSFHAEIDDRDLSVAPLLLLPLVENCFKHCGDLNSPDAISITLTLRDGVLRFSTSNNLPTAESAHSNAPHGVGLTVFQRRLELLYQGRYHFTASPVGTRFLTDLEVPLLTHLPSKPRPLSAVEGKSK